MSRSWVLFGFAVVAAACTPDFGDTTAIVSSPRLLAVAGTPAEGPTGTTFTLSSLYVGPGGPADASSLEWGTCLLQKPLGDPGSVDPACLTRTTSAITALGHGSSVRGTIPDNACELFGPESPPPMVGQPSARPTDPDSTGGYYLPIRVLAQTDSVAFERIACQPSGVLESVFTAFTTGYVMNENPVVRSLARVEEGGAPTSIAPDGTNGGPSVTVAPGAQLTLSVSWPTCPETVAACGGAETFLRIDPTTKELTTSRESMVASWYASAGSFALDRVGRDSNDDATSVMNTWIAPSTSVAAHVWIVLRDARGGVGWQSYTIEVGP